MAKIKRTLWPNDKMAPTGLLVLKYKCTKSTCAKQLAFLKVSLFFYNLYYSISWKVNEISNTSLVTEN